MGKKLNVSIIGAGLIGNKRAEAIMEIGDDKILAVVDVNLEKAGALASKTNAKVYKNWQEVVKDPKVDAVIVSTTTDVNSKITEALLKAKKHVLVEKPLGASVKEAEELFKISKQNRRNLKVGSVLIF
jgi:predicted dehydrogenase